MDVGLDLIEAVEQGNIPHVQALLRHEAHLQRLTLDQMGEALLYIAEAGAEEGLRLLMALPRFRKINPRYLNRALTLAASRGHRSLLLTFLAYNARLGKLSPLALDEARREAADGGFEACVEVLLEQRPL